MKRYSKMLFILLSLTLLLMSLAIGASADDTVYKITSSDGTVTEYTDPLTFPASISNANDGDIVTLLADIELKEEITIETEDGIGQREIFLDLAGHGIHAHKKQLLFIVKKNTTLNVYSSKSNAFLYVEEKTDYSMGGGIFTVGDDTGDGSRINFGTMTVGGTEYPGSNITTFSSCVVQVGNSGEAEFYADGGTHIANVQDWSGFICHRSSVPKIIIKNADLLMKENTNPISSMATAGEVLLENCNIIRLDGAVKPILNQSLGKVTLKNCVTNFSASADSPGKISANSLIIEGNTLFASSELQSSIVSDTQGKILAYTNHEYKFKNGEASLKCFGKFVGETDYKEFTVKMPDIYAGAALMEKADSVECIWKNAGTEEINMWQKGLTPKAPFELVGKMQEGMFKLGWFSQREDNRILYTATNILDFNIKISVSYVKYPVINIYIPAFVIDDAYLDFSEVTLNDDYLGKDAWEYKEIDGVGYYRTSTYDISYVPDEEFTLVLACDFGSGNTAKSSWYFSVPEYFENISLNEENFTAEQLAVVAEIKNKIYKTEE